MPPSHLPQLRGPRSAPSLSAIVHGSHLVSFDDGLLLPSSCHSRTWLLDGAEGPCGLGRAPRREPEACPQGSGEPGGCLPGAVPAAGSQAGTCERTTCPSGGSWAEFGCETQPCPAASSQPAGFALQSRPAGSHRAEPCTPRAHESTKCPAPECGPSQGHPQGPGARSCSPLVPAVPGPQLPGPSSGVSEPPCCVSEPPCCVTGGW